MEPNDALAKAVRRLGTGLALDAPRTRGILADYGVSKRLVSALVAAVEAGVASEATLGRAGEPEASRFDRLARQLHEQMATDEALARWAVEAWAAALRPVSGDLIRDAEGGGGSPIDRPVRDRSRAGRDSTNGGRGGPTDGWIAPQADLDDSSGPEPEAYDDGRQADGDQAPDRQRGEDPQAGVEPGKTQRDDRGWPDRSDGTRPPERTDDEPVIAESTTPVSGPGPKRKRRRALVAVVVTAVATSAGVVVVVWRHRDITVCGPSSKTLCVVGGPYALVDSRRTGHDQTLRSGQTITSNGGSPAVRVRSRGNEVFLDRGTSVRVLGDGTLSLRTGRLWVLVGASGAGDARVLVDGPSATNVDVRGAALLETLDGRPAVTVRTGQAILNHSTTVTALNRVVGDGAGGFTPSAPFLPDTEPGDAIWLHELPPPIDAHPNPLAASVAGPWQANRTVQATDYRWNHTGDLTHRQLELHTDCARGSCSLTATVGGSSAPVTFDGASYHSLIRPQGQCGGAPTLDTLALDFTPTGTTDVQAWPSASGLAGTWVEHFDGGGICTDHTTTFAFNASTDAVDPRAFPTRDEETALTEAYEPWNLCQRRAAPVNALASVSCTGGNGIASITVTKFKDQSSLLAAYNTIVSASGVAPGSYNAATGVGESVAFPTSPGRSLTYVNTAGAAERLTETTSNAILVEWVGTSRDIKAFNAARSAQIG